MNPFTMRSKRLHLLTIILASFVFLGCTRETEQFQTEHLSEYLPLQVGKYITYRLDSTVFLNFGTVTAVHSYQEKHVIDAQITDATGRLSYRILRFIRDTAGIQPWISAGTYSITPNDSVIEVNENNLRFIKLALPIKQDFSWKGNRYLPDDAFAPVFNFNSDYGINNWDYTYSSIEGTLLLNGQTYNNVLTVDGIDDNFNANKTDASVINPVAPAYVNYIQDNYAKGIGLISQAFIFWEYDPIKTAKVGFGVKRSIIDHN